MSDGLTFDAVRIDCIEKTGLVTQAEGLPRIAGRVFGMLIYDGNVVSFGDLATKLQASRGSISTSILEERGLVKRVTKPGESQDFFQLAATSYVTILEGNQKRNRSIKTDIAETIAGLPTDADAGGRLTAHANFYASLDAAVALAVSELDTSKNPIMEQQPAALKDNANDK